MKRVHWFEFMDFKWFPNFLRDIITDTIKVSDKNPMFDRIVSVIVNVLDQSKINTVVDLCSDFFASIFGRYFHFLCKCDKTVIFDTIHFRNLCS